MNRIIVTYITALISLSFAPTSQAEPANKIQANYDVIGYGMTLAIINESFTRTKDSYRIESVTKAVGMLARFKPETIRVTSLGSITLQGLQPLSYSLIREVDTQKNASARFNWTDAVLTHIDYKGTNTLPLPVGTQDRLSVLYHLLANAKNDQTEFKLSITDGSNLEDYIFVLSPNIRDVNVPLGSFKTRYISNTPIGEELKYEIWMAIEQHYFPCKIIVTDSKGGKLTQVLTQLTIVP